MYSYLPTFAVGFHGCDKETKNSVINGKSRLKPSKNEYDWLGNGIYFWENNPKRALKYAENIAQNPKKYNSKIEKPASIGAFIDMTKCFNLLDSKLIDLLKNAYEAYKKICEVGEATMAENKIIEKGVPLKRNLDCAVIETLHSIRDENELPEFDTVRGVFFEGAELYEGSGFKEKNHIQICVRNPNCIKGYFDPLKKIPTHPLP